MNRKILLAMIFAPVLLAGQKYDYVWLLGKNSLTDIDFAGTVIDFNTSPPDIYYEFRGMGFYLTNASISDASGHLLFYTNGISLFNALNEIMENGDGLNPGQLAISWQDYGYVLDQGAIILPVPESDSLSYLLHMDRESNENQTSSNSKRFYFSLIDMNQNIYGTVVKKNEIVKQDIYELGKLTATRHANGRDWWVLLREFGSNLYYRFLVTPNGINSKGFQTIGEPIPSPAIGQAVFSPDGTKFANVHLTGYLGDAIYISVYSFDRCTGNLSAPIQWVYADSASSGGVAISPNSRFLYVPSFKYLYQYDLWADNIAESKDTIAIWDGFLDPPVFATTFYMAQLAPDGKIYISSNNSVHYLHVINHPDLPGDSCDVCQHCIEMPSKNAFSLPNFPNFRLGPLEGSPCDTLRSPPQAAWQYESSGLEVVFRDSSRHDIRSWSWNFGDGTTDTLMHSTHIYEAPGAYEVCLAVENPRGADTLCHIVQVVIDAVGDPITGQIRVSPNPARDVLSVQLSSDRTAKALFRLLDAQGREVVNRVLSGRDNAIEVSRLPSGLYFYEVWEDSRIVARGKVAVE